MNFVSSTYREICVLAVAAVTRPWGSALALPWISYAVGVAYPSS